ncbi:MAG TPA: hypothetical protein VMU72_07325 [Gaiellaceae bacterium]|nr:hypothetical protein [Gaiellaceae bacterium]
MKKILVISAIAAIAFSTSQALAAAPHHAAVKHTLVVAMHDPGCHWFSIHGKLTTHATVSGPVRVVDRDEATMKVASRHGMQRIPVGTGLVLRRGHYVLMMVGQAVDDNYLKLTVR